MESLKEYIESKVFPEYDKNEQGHGIAHIKTVIDRSNRLSRGYDVNMDMVYTIASFHDIGHHINKDKHEIISAEIMEKDMNLKNWFSDEQILIMKEAIEDHRASLNREPRSIYGKIISSADRTIIDIDNTIRRTYLYGKKHESNYTHEQLVNRVYEHLSHKYGENGYAKCYIKDEEFENALNSLRSILKDKESFCKRVEECVVDIK